MRRLRILLPASALLQHSIPIFGLRGNQSFFFAGAIGKTKREEGGVRERKYQIVILL